MYAGVTDVDDCYKNYDKDKFSENSMRWVVDFVDNLLYLNSNSEETATTTADGINLTSNGIMCTMVGSNTNASGPWYFCAAWADVPGHSSQVSPTPAN